MKDLFRSPLWNNDDDYSGGEGEIETDVSEIEEVQEHGENEDEQEVNLDEYIPKNVALQWKKELKESRNQLNQYKVKEMEESKSKSLERIKRMAIDKGYDEEFAHFFSEAASEILATIPQTHDPISDEVEAELEDIGDKELFAMKKEIVSKVKKYRKADPDFSIEDAIKLIGKQPKSKKSEKEIELEVEQRQAVARRYNDKQPVTSSGSSVKEKYPMSSDDIRVWKQLNADDPKRWTKEKYYNLMIKNKRR
jgi:hypothetical protein